MLEDSRGRRHTTEVLFDFVAGGEDPLTRAMTPEPALITMRGDIEGQVFRLRIGRQLIGRRPECDIRLRERAVSGIHAEVVRSANGVTIKDLASTNGTLVNGLRIRETAPLTQGQLVRIGTCVFKYVDSLLDVEFTEALHEKGITDSLTGAYNKAYVIARLAYALDGVSETNAVSVIAFDYDDFKRINDEKGHAAGDEALHGCTQLVRNTCVREGDLLARVGGDEFAIVCVGTTLASAANLADEVRRCIAESSFGVTASFGVCSATAHAETPEALLARADALLYRAKHGGRNRVIAE
jgi:diguanylate cyclase (GGDEF)-like protein